MAHLAITVEGGLISSDLVEQIAATPQDVPGQRPADFGLDGRLSDEIQTTFSDAFIHWNAFQARLARGKESATTITRETWMLPLLEELDFTLTFQRAAAVAGGATFTISHRFGAEPDAPPVHIVSRDQELDRKGSEARSPHALVQDYLNRSDALWGIVTNGLKLRLLRNTVRFSKPSFIEFDLKAIFEGNLYSEFVLFYRLVHSTRLPRSASDAHECWLERYYQQGIEQGGRVRERLRDGVEEALKILGTGFLAHPESNGLREKLRKGELSHLDYYRELLRLIYRLLFLMVAEERRLLFVLDHDNAARQEIYDRWYSIERLRRRAMESRLFDDGHSDLWEGLKQTFTLFEDSRHASELGLTALDGELFGRFACADLIDTHHEAGPRLRNADLLAAIWYLSTFEDADGHKRKAGVRRRVNFGGLDVEEFGSVYESLLDYHPEVTIDGPRSKFDLIAGSERSATGSYYTPPELVLELIKSVLEPVIEERLAKGATRHDKERALLSLKVCDPASGSGHFMLAAARRIGRELARVRSGEAEPNPADYRHAVRDVIRRCIYAVDKNPLAVDLCKVALWIEGNEPGLPLSFLDHHVKCGDSLVGVFDLKVLEAGIPDDAYKALTGDDKKVAGEIRKRNRDEAKRDSLFRHSVEQDIEGIAGKFGAVADLPETSPDEVQAKEAAYRALRQSSDWEKAKWACDLWTAAFFAPLNKDDAVAVPTTRVVWDAIGGRLPQGRVAGGSIALAAAQGFFHWPLEFPEVFAQGGFDIALGNPPWGVLQFNEQKFFASRDLSIARATGATRKALIQRLSSDKPALAREYEEAKKLIGKASTFVRRRTSAAFEIEGKVNTYLVFAGLFIAMRREHGRSGILLPTNIIADTSNASFVKYVLGAHLLAQSLNFYEIRQFFPGTDSRGPFGLYTFANHSLNPVYVFRANSLEELSIPARRLTLNQADIQRLNPIDGCIPGLRTAADLALVSKIYSAPVVDPQFSSTIDYAQGMYNMTTASGKFLDAIDVKLHGNQPFGVSPESGIVPIIEGKNFSCFDPVYQSFSPEKNDFEIVDSATKNLGLTGVIARYYVPAEDVRARLLAMGITKKWHLLIRETTLAANERTAIACLYPLFGVGHTCEIVLGSGEFDFLLLAQLNSLCLDFVVRCKLVGVHVTHPFLKQLPFITPKQLQSSELAFIADRTLRLMNVDPLYIQISASFVGNFCSEIPSQITIEANQRAFWQSELDAYFAYLYGLTRRELEYILDPKAVMGEDYPSETFRVLKENEIKEFGEYRTQRLVLEAWDRFAADGTFDPVRLREPQYIDRVAQELTATRERLEQIERDSKTLLTFATATPKPTLFVEGVTDAKIIEAAWAVFFPREPMPVKVISAGGTKEMGSLAGKGKALREVLGDNVVLVLADNDSAGRLLVAEDGHLRKGGVWRLQQNGIHWCLLKPTAPFLAVMEAHKIPADYRPFTIEAAFPPALRRRAEADGAWRFSGTPQAELLDNAELAKRLFVCLPKLGPADDAYWYLMAPAPEAKEAFAGWVTDPKRRTEENYAAFEEVIRGVRDLLAQKGQGQPKAA